MPSLSKLWTVLAAAAMGVVVSAQAVEFEVASVKLHTLDDRRTMMVAQPGGRFVAANISLKLLIRTTFQIQDDQIVGGPGWLATDGFDIEAKAPAGRESLTELQGLLRALLADRFKLVTHMEKRELPVFALERARRDGGIGSGLRPTDCPELSVDINKPVPCATIQNGLGLLTLRGAPLDQFTPWLSTYVSRVVVNRTGLEGRFDIELKWTPEPGGPAPVGGAAQTPPSDPNAISIFTALQEQLGLKLESTKDLVDVLIIDSVEHPTPN
jgi:uncharacterized protein (TIGR03435 family)